MVTSRIWFTAAQKAELWERWKNGQSAAAISRGSDVPQPDRQVRSRQRRASCWVSVITGGTGPKITGPQHF
jgi:hypothetical protein